MAPRVLILGLPYFGKMLSRVLAERGWDARYHEHPGRDLRAWVTLTPLVARADLVYLISSRVDRWSPQAMLAAIRRVPIVIHWVGGDVLFAREEHVAGRSSQRLIERAVHLADAPWLTDELAEIGVEADYVPLPAPSLHTEDPPGLPEVFRALIYYPVDPLEREVFDWDTLIGLVEAFPDIPFQLVTSPPETLPAPLPPNLEATGWVTDMDALYREITVYIRLTVHDGTSFMAIESLSRGRYVIWTFPLAGGIQARGLEEASTALGELYERHQRGALGLNHAGREAVLREFDPERLASELDARLRGALRKTTRAR